jgi:hypothetical protein
MYKAIVTFEPGAKIATKGATLQLLSTSISAKSMIHLSKNSLK